MSEEMNKQVATLAFRGDWGELMPLLRRDPALVDSPSQTKGYTPLHQAAWHGVAPAIIGELLSLGADRSLKTIKGQTAQEIAAQKHREREDLQYLLAPHRRTLGQLMRKSATASDTFKAYDGNQTVFDQLVRIFDAEPCPRTDEETEARVAAAFQAVTGIVLSDARREDQLIHDFGVEDFQLPGDLSFWKDRFFRALGACRSRAHKIPIEREWATVSDLFEPAPAQWGLRGDLFLWIEMRQALCHVELPENAEALAQTLSATFAALTGNPLGSTGQIPVDRFARGGMSGGFVSCEFWSRIFIPSLQLRLKWLRESWQWQTPGA